MRKLVLAFCAVVISVAGAGCDRDCEKKGTCLLPTAPTGPVVVACEYIMPPNARGPFEAAISFGGFSVETRPKTGCSWTATSSNPDWIRLTNGLNGPIVNSVAGAGDGDVNYRIEQNDGTARTGTIAVRFASGAIQHFAIAQKGR